MKAAARMPALFLGHGNPMLTLSSNAYTAAWTQIGRSVPRPKAVLAVSAHWYIPHCAVTANAQPSTIHDFGGFPEELFQVEYPAAGCPALARRVQELLTPVPVKLSEDWGLDHGTWSVLRHIFPKADIPVVQLSLDRTQPPEFHFETGKRLRPLRDEGVLVVGSGNIVHNLSRYVWGNGDVPPFAWAVQFERHVRESLAKREDRPLIETTQFGQDARLSIPTPDHYLPFLYILGLREQEDPVSFPVEGFDGGSMSMLAVQVG